MPYFAKWTSFHVHQFEKKRGVPIKMLALCILRYLGTGWTVDDLEESTAISHETIRQFIHAFICFGSDTLYNKYVIAPLRKEDT